MRGLIGIGVGLPAPTTKPAPTAPPTTTSTPGAPQSAAVAAGAAVWAADGCINCHSVSEVETQSGGDISGINSTHSGGPFANGPLTAAQIQQLAAFINN